MTEIEMGVVVAVGEGLAIGGLGVLRPLVDRGEAVPVREPNRIVALAEHGLEDLLGIVGVPLLARQLARRAVRPVVAGLHSGSQDGLGCLDIALLGEEHAELGP
ncbi:MAG: hypothetical protein M3065_20800 [Actinomycetota bacterium]|nr:hypothetical protein [Actinomycetota bacterium]